MPRVKRCGIEIQHWQLRSICRCRTDHTQGTKGPLDKTSEITSILYIKARLVGFGINRKYAYPSWASVGQRVSLDYENISRGAECQVYISGYNFADDF